MAVSKVILNGETLIDVTQKTVTPSNMLSGITALKNDGEDITGNIASKTSTDLIASGATVTAPAGYYASSASKSIDNGSLKSLGIAYNSNNHFLQVSGGVQTSGYLEQQNKTTEFNTAAYLPTQAASTITPTESEQTAVEQYKWTTGVVKVGAISSTYVGSGIAQRSSADLTASGSKITAPAGYYAAAASKFVASGTAGTPTASKGTVSNHSVSVTPSVTNTTGYITGGTKTGTAVTVTASELESGTKSITANGSGIDVTGYSAVDVAIPGGNVTQDANGYIVLPSTGGGGGGSGSGLVHESGTFSPTTDNAYPSISFANTHTTRPFFVMIIDSDLTTQSSLSTNSVLSWEFVSFYDYFGHGIYQNSGSNNIARGEYAISGERGTTSGGYNVTALTGTQYSAMNYSLTESGFSPYPGGSANYYRSGRTYTWVAVWAPTT